VSPYTDSEPNSPNSNTSTEPNTPNKHEHEQKQSEQSINISFIDTIINLLTKQYNITNKSTNRPAPLSTLQAQLVRAVAVAYGTDWTDSVD
jgi:hypothetical protein